MLVGLVPVVGVAVAGARVLIKRKIAGKAILHKNRLEVPKVSVDHPLGTR